MTTAISGQHEKNDRVSGDVNADEKATLLHAGKGIEDFGGAARGGDQYPFRDLPYINLYITYQDALGNYIRQDLSGVITAVDYPEGGKGRIARLPDTNPPQIVAEFVSMGAAGDDDDETN